RAGAGGADGPARTPRRRARPGARRGPSEPVDRVVVALGSNLGDRRSHLDFAVSKLRALLTNLAVSRYYNTVPVGVSGPQAMFLNAAAAGETTLSARALLDALLAIEEERGRERPYP